MCRTALLLSLLLIACSTPKSGDWYEHKGTRERVRVSSVGLGKDIYRSWKRNLESEIDIFKTTASGRVERRVVDGDSMLTYATMILELVDTKSELRIWHIIHYWPMDSLEECVRYDKFELTNPVKKECHIVELRQFLNDYSLVK